MLTGLANYLFGVNEFTDEVLENLFKETPIKGGDGDDWILVELRQQQLDSTNGLNDQSTGCLADIEPGTGSLASSTNKLPDDEKKENQLRASTEISLTDDDKKSTNDESVSGEDQQSTANNYSTIGNVEESEEDGEEEDENVRYDGVIDLINNNNDAKNQETANKRKKRESHENNNHTGTMEGSWFMTPPPCFVSHKKSINKVSTSPLEDILIEHPSISVFHSHTSSSLGSFYPLPSQSSLSPTTNTIGSPSSSQHSPCPTLHLLPSRLRFADLTSLATVAVSSIVALATPPAASNRSTRSNRGQRNGSSSNTRNNNNNNRLNDEAIQPPRAGETRGANLENHERNGHLSEITNHHLAPMQKAMNQGSQKYLKKSFLNRQNLVKTQSNPRPNRRQRCTQQPRGSNFNNRKMC